MTHVPEIPEPERERKMLVDQLKAVTLELELVSEENRRLHALLLSINVLSAGGR